MRRMLYNQMTNFDRQIPCLTIFNIFIGSLLKYVLITVYCFLPGNWT